jgi:hypothetical protein
MIGIDCSARSSPTARATIYRLLAKAMEHGFVFTSAAPLDAATLRRLSILRTSGNALPLASRGLVMAA